MAARCLEWQSLLAADLGLKSSKMGGLKFEGWHRVVGGQRKRWVSAGAIPAVQANAQKC
jgi:hypothetical protein